MAYESIFNAIRPERQERETEESHDLRAQSADRSLLAGATPLLVGLLSGNMSAGASVAGDALLGEDKRLQGQQGKLLDHMRKRDVASEKKDKLGKRFQFITVEDDKGNVHYAPADTYTGNIDTSGEKLVKGYAPRIGVDPTTGELARTSKGSGRNVPIKTEGATEKPFNVKSEKDIKAMKDKLMSDPEYRRARSGMSASSRAVELLKSNNPVSDEGIKTVFPRMFGEVGNLAVQEQERFSGSPELTRKFGRLKEKWVEGKLTDEDRRDLLEVAQVMFEYDKGLIDSVVSQHSRSTALQTGIDEKKARETIEPFAEFNMPKGKIAEKVKKDFVTRLTGEDKGAYEWAMKNKKDPKAKKFLDHLKSKYGE